MNKVSHDFAADTHTGLRHQLNEDTFCAAPETGLWLIADGIGGQPDGEVASAIARDTIAQCIAHDSSLEDAVKSSHDAILNAIAEGKGAAGMGSTVVATLLRGDHFEVCWVGDSRAYLWDTALTPLTQDHNRATQLLHANTIDAAQARNHPERHILTQSLGVSPAIDLTPGLVDGELYAGQCLLLCSDGLSDELSDSLIAQILSEHQSPRAQVDALISAALDAGGRDNITALIVTTGSATDRQRLWDDGDHASRNTRRSASGGKPNDGQFPLRTALITVVVLAALLALLIR